MTESRGFANCGDPATGKGEPGKDDPGNTLEGVGDSAEKGLGEVGPIETEPSCSPSCGENPSGTVGLGTGGGATKPDPCPKRDAWVLAPG